jgi:hypothetical protein
MPIEKLILQKEEVTDARWVSIIEFEEMCLQELIVPSVANRFNLYRGKILNYMNSSAL